jgi:hypothetical protein
VADVTGFGPCAGRQTSVAHVGMLSHGIVNDQSETMIETLPSSNGVAIKSLPESSR